MQICGLDEEKIILAENAIKHKSYLCPECFQEIRLKDGPLRRKHFFHLTANRQCYQHQKDSTHLGVQQAIISQLKEGEATLEKHFKEISRIADIAWTTRKIIFEIQCSPITLSELKKRNEDYSSIGYQVIWILHQKNFNKRSLRAVEHYLQDKIFYYTSINSKGDGCIYDQFTVIKNGRHLYKSFPINVSLNFPQKIAAPKHPMPVQLLQKITNNPFYFQNDLISKAREKPEYARWMIDIEKRLLEKKKKKHSIKNAFIKAHKTILYLLLKKIAR